MRELIQQMYSLLRFKFAVLKADSMHATTGKRYFVIPYHHSKKLLVVNNDIIKSLRKSRVLRKNIGYAEVMKSCLYFTKCAGRNDGAMDEETKKINQANYINYARKYQ